MTSKPEEMKTRTEEQIAEPMAFEFARNEVKVEHFTVPTLFLSEYGRVRITNSAYPDDYAILSPGKFVRIAVDGDYRMEAFEAAKIKELVI